MGSLTLQNMRDELRYTLGNRTTTELPDTNVDRWLNWSYLHIARPSIYTHRELRVGPVDAAMVTNQETYALVGGFGLTNVDDLAGIRALVYREEGYRLQPTSLNRFLEVYRTGDGGYQQGRPTHYIQDGANILVTPRPTSAEAGDNLDLYYWGTVGNLSGSGAASSLGDDWDEVIVVGGVWRAYRALELYDRAELAKTEFGQMINEAHDRLKWDKYDEGWEGGPILQPYMER